MSFQNKIKSLGLSVTPVRLAVLEALTHSPHAEALHIFDHVQKNIKTTSIQAIYKNLNVLVDVGLVREIKPMGMSSLYETRVGDNHHHLVCRNCGTVQDTHCLGAAPCLVPADSKGFDIDEAEIIFWGICSTCQSQ